MSRGDMLAIAHRYRATLVWMAEEALALNRPYIVKDTTQRVYVAVVRLNELPSVEIETHRPLLFDPHDRATGAFVVIDPIGNQLLGSGTLTAATGEQPTPPQPGETGHPGPTVWFTGLSGAGKSTLCQAVGERLRAKGYTVECLDGDQVRRTLNRDLGFSKEDRDENIRRIGFVAGVLSRNGAIALVAAISPYRTVRDEMRAGIGNFVEVYVNAPLALCESRDRKGLYARARAGELSGVTGIDDPYEPPENPEVECRTDRETVAESAGKVLRYLETQSRDGAS